MKVEKILLIRNDRIGDLILSLSIIKGLKKSFPKAKIDFIVSPENKPILEKNTDIRNLIVVKHSPRNLTDLSKYYVLSRKLRKEKYDLGFALRGSFFNILFLLFLSKIEHRVGFYNQLVSKPLLHFSRLKDNNKHTSLRMIEIMNDSLGLKSKNYWPEIAIDKKDKSEFKKFIKKRDLNKFISINVDASLETKQWPLKKFNLLIKYISKKYPQYKILLVGTDEGKIQFLLGKNPSCLPVVKVNLRLLYLLLEESSLAITSDGGPMHLAWAAKTKLLALIPGILNGNKYPIESIKPLGKNSKILVSTTNSVDSISLEEVKREIRKFLR